MTTHRTPNTEEIARLEALQERAHVIRVGLGDVLTAHQEKYENEHSDLRDRFDTALAEEIHISRKITALIEVED